MFNNIISLLQDEIDAVTNDRQTMLDYLVNFFPDCGWMNDDSLRQLCIEQITGNAKAIFSNELSELIKDNR